MTEPHLDARAPLRDRPTRISYTQLALFAWLMYGLGAANALLRDDQGTSRTLSGLHGTSVAAAGVLSGLVASRLISALGRGLMLRLSAIGVVVGVVVYTWPDAGYAMTMAGSFLIGMFGTFVVISVNAFLIAHQGAGGPSSLSEANALAALAGLIAPLAIGAAAATVLGWRAGILLAAVGMVAVEIWRGRSTSVYGEAGASAHEHHRTQSMPRRIYWTLAIIMCLVGTEFVMVYWSADLLRDRAGFGPAAAAAALACLTGGMAVGRYAGAHLARHYSIERILQLSLGVAAIGFALAWISMSGAVVLIGLVVTGLGLSVQWPLLVTRAVRASGGMTDRAAARCSVFASAAIAVAPFLLGVLSDTIGFHTAFLLVPALLAAAFALLVARPLAD